MVRIWYASLIDAYQIFHTWYAWYASAYQIFHTWYAWYASGTHLVRIWYASLIYAYQIFWYAQVCTSRTEQFADGKCPRVKCFDKLVII